ncbi:MAG: 7-cyano-7-deazaguanine synthase QueC [bacterium]
MAGAIALLSGGLDSVVAVKLALRNEPVELAVTFDYGQRARKRETEMASIFCRANGIEHRVIELPWLSGATKTALVDKSMQLPEVSPDALDQDAEKRAISVWVPNRNGVFISIAAAIAEARGSNCIIVGFNAEEGETFPDNSQAFVTAMNEALAVSTINKVAVRSATLSMRKTAIAREFASLGLDPDSFWCCYDGGDELCGKCESCARTIRAFHEADAWDLVMRRFPARP